METKETIIGTEIPTDLGHLIDCDAAPFIPNGWSVEEHKKGGHLKFDPAKVSLYLSEKQKKGSISGYDLREELSGKPAMNANVLDYLLAHQERIPESWKSELVFFWNTKYRYYIGHIGVRCLGWSGFRWYWCHVWLGDNFGTDYPAALES